MRTYIFYAVVFVMLLGGAGCTSTSREIFADEPTVAESDPTHDALLALPDPSEKIVVALYTYQDKTGKYQHGDVFQSLSRAVTQGADAILLKALQDAGDGSWFTVVERAGLGALLKERQILREGFAIYQENDDPKAVPPLTIAGVLLEGGIISFDSNMSTGGFGARFLGVGAHTQYRKDTVTVYLRATSVLNGEILASVNVTKTIYAVALSASAFRYVSESEILEVEAGVTNNEPEYFAIKQAIEKAVIALIFEGSKKGIWGFEKETPELRALFEAYQDEKKQKPFKSKEVEPAS